MCQNLQLVGRTVTDHFPLLTVERGPLHFHCATRTAVGRVVHPRWRRRRVQQRYPVTATSAAEVEWEQHWGNWGDLLTIDALRVVPDVRH